MRARSPLDQIAALEHTRDRLREEIAELKRIVAAHRRLCLQYEYRLSDFMALERRGMLSPRPKRNG
jgi:hypothetical protein